MAALVDAEGKPHFKYIVEGANLFLTQQARLHLEKRKVVLFKDSSANKGKPNLNSQRGSVLMYFRWRDEFLPRGPRRSRSINRGIYRAHDFQRW